LHNFEAPNILIFLTKSMIFDTHFDFEPIFFSCAKFRFLRKNFYQKYQFLAKISIFKKRYKFLPKISIFNKKNPIFAQNLDFYRKYKSIFVLFFMEFQYLHEILFIAYFTTFVYTVINIRKTVIFGSYVQKAFFLEISKFSKFHNFLIKILFKLHIERKEFFLKKTFCHYSES